MSRPVPRLLKIAYTVPYPATGAVGQRVFNLSRTLLATGIAVELVVLAPSMEPGLPTAPGLTFVPAEVLPEGPRSRSEKLKRRLRLGMDTVRVLEEMTRAPDLVIVYGGGDLYMSRIQRWARSRDSHVAADLVEWFEPSHQPLGRYGPLALDNHLMMTRTALRSDGIIAISSFLARHFTAKGARHVLVVPPLMDTDGFTADDAPGLATRAEFVYCGEPGKKDRLDLVLRSALELDPDGTRMTLTVAGPTPERVARLAGVDVLPPGINAVGRISRDESLKLVRHAHWVPLIREDKRFAQAGFPTKAAEAMSVGTPIVANLTSDLGKLLTDGQTGVVAAAADLESTKIALTNALTFTHDRHEQMRRATHRRAQELLDYRQHISPLGRWLAEVVGDNR